MDSEPEPSPDKRWPTFEEMFEYDSLKRSLWRQAKIHIHDVETLLRWAPLGLEGLCWRASEALEDFHAESGSWLDDAEMFRINTQTTFLFRSHLNEFMEMWLEGSYPSLAELDEISPESVEAFFEEMHDDIFNSDRFLPNSKTLKDLGEQYEPLATHGWSQFVALQKIAEQKGFGIVVAWLALRGVMNGKYHFTTPEWPRVVESFMQVAEDPSHEWWEKDWRTYPEWATHNLDAPRMRELLLTSPWDLNYDEASFCVHQVGIEFVRTLWRKEERAAEAPA